MKWNRLRWTPWVLLLGVLVWPGCSSEPGPLTGTRVPSMATPPAGDFAIPPGYYDSVDLSTSITLRNSLHEIVKDHTKIPYTSTATDTWDVLEQADQDPNDPTRILDLYMNASYPKYGGGNDDYNREHTWPKSYGFPNDSSTNFPYTDCHHLFLCNDSYNSSRSNKPYRYCEASCSENPTVFNDGAGGGSGVYPGNSNWTSGSYTQGTWETWIGRRGDVARALFYMDVRYEGGTNGNTHTAEPDLILTDDEALIEASNTGNNELVAYMGMLSVLLQWSQEDPVDDKERAHNEAVYQYQGNRNPFVDHPEWIDCVFTGSCGSGDTTPPATPTGLVASAGDGVVDLDWDDNTESDLSGYNVYRSETGEAPWTLLNTSLVGVSSYTDQTVTNGVSYTYAVSAVDDSQNESGLSASASATPTGGSGGGGPLVWINEFHYDNVGNDNSEFVEIAGPAGTDLGGWSVVGYNGNGGAIYDTVNLSGVIADQQGGYGTLDFSFAGMQNGSPDGLALVDANGSVLQFLSYEGSFTAVDGPAAGMSSTDIGIFEDSDTPRRYSLQLQGTGTAYADFAWGGPLAKTDGEINTGQSFGEGGGGQELIVHVDSITPDVESTAGGRFNKAKVTVVVKDDTGALVEGVTVTLNLSGDFTETLSGVTDASGSVVLTSSDKVKGAVSYTACVDDLALDGGSYDSDSNVESCDSYGSV